MADSEAARRERAMRRRATWTGEIVAAGTPKPPLHSAMSAEERVSAMTRLCERLWRASGRPPPEPIPRSEWPGEIFEIRS